MATIQWACLLVIAPLAVAQAQTPVNRDSIWAQWRRLARTLPQTQAIRDSAAALIKNAPKDMRDSMRARSSAELETARDSLFTVAYGCPWPRRVLPDSVRHARRVRIGEDICAVLERTYHPFTEDRYTSQSGDYLMWRAGGYTRITFRWDGHAGGSSASWTEPCGKNVARLSGRSRQETAPNPAICA